MTTASRIMDGLIDDGHDVTHADQLRRRHVRRGARSVSPFLDRPRGVTVSGDIRHDQAGPRHLRSSRRGIRPRARGHAVHRRQPEECRRRQGGRLAGGAVHRTPKRSRRTSSVSGSRRDWTNGGPEISYASNWQALRRRRAPCRARAMRRSSSIAVSPPLRS